MSEFQREDRYIVIKRSDLKKVPVAYRSHLVDPMFALLAHLPQRRFAVIESDWPEFEPVWRMIEARVTGVPVPGPQYLCVRYGLLQECSPQDRQYVSSGDYDALAAQRDEGLALLGKTRAWIEAARDGVLYPIARDFDGVVGFNAEGLGQQAPQLLDAIDQILASPGCADGEPTK